MSMDSLFEPCGEEWMAFCSRGGTCYRKVDTTEKICRCPDGVEENYCQTFAISTTSSVPVGIDPADVLSHRDVNQMLCNDTVASYQKVLVIVSSLFAVLFAALLLYFALYVKFRHTQSRKLVRFRTSLTPNVEDPNTQTLIQCPNCGTEIASNSGRAPPSINDNDVRFRKAVSMPPYLDREGNEQQLDYDPSCPHCFGNAPISSISSPLLSRQPMLMTSGKMPASETNETKGDDSTKPYATVSAPMKPFSYATELSGHDTGSRMYNVGSATQRKQSNGPISTPTAQYSERHIMI